MDSKCTSISAGLLIRPFLLESAFLASTLKGIYPCVAPDGATFPYIEYHCVGLDVIETKSGSPTDRLSFEFNVYSEDYEEGVNIAEVVRDILCSYRPSRPAVPLSYHGAVVSNRNEGWAGDCYCQSLVITTRISIT